MELGERGRVVSRSIFIESLSYKGLVKLSVRGAYTARLRIRDLCVHAAHAKIPKDTPETLATTTSK
jgi:hypothetical protein